MLRTILALFFLMASTPLVAEEKKVQNPKQQKVVEKKKVTEKKKVLPKKKVYYYYPKAKNKVALTKENYQKVNTSLKGLKAVYINLDSYILGSKKRNMKIGFDMKKKVREILKKHNIKLLDKNSVKWKFGQPTIRISASFPAFLGPYKKGEKKKKYKADCCTASVSASLTEGASVLRDPNVNMLLTTWKSAERTTDCSKLENWFPKAVIKVVEKFVNDKAGKKTIVKKIVKKVIKKPVVKKEKVVKKTVVKKEKVVKYAGHNRVQQKRVVKTVVKKKPVVRKVKQVEKLFHPARTYYAPTVTVPVVKEVTERVIVQSAPKEVVCSNNEFIATSQVLGEELYRKVIRYERVQAREEVVKYEVLAPVQTVVVQKTIERKGCNKVMNMEMELFQTNSSHILSSKQFILDSLAHKINDCPNYIYTIETHADQRGSHEANDRLTEQRANALAKYLRGIGIGTNRFHVKSFGERRPLKFGTTEQDHSKNRRVVVIPNKIQIR